MPLTLLLLYGSMGGLAGVLVSAVLRPLLPGTQGTARVSLRELIEVGAHLFAGAGIAALYWLSWGFAALVAVPWWQRGLAFGSACWLALALPVLIALAAQAHMPARRLAALAFEWAWTCVLAGLACAWSWQTLP